MRDRALALLLKSVSGNGNIAGDLETLSWNAALREAKAAGFGTPLQPRAKETDIMVDPLIWCGAVRRRYCTHVRALAYSLTHAPGLRDKLNDGIITPRELFGMHPYARYPDRWRESLENSAMRSLRRETETSVLHGEELEAAPDGLLQCNRCRSKKTSYYELQTRSADEPATVFASCRACGKRWKQ